MYCRSVCLFVVVVATSVSCPVQAREAIKLAANPALSSDGTQLLFDWRGDIWLVNSEGGVARQITTSSAIDRRPVFSPQDDQVAFISDRTGADQLFLVDLQGGIPRQLTFHTEGCERACWFPDGESLLVEASRDHFWRHANRFFQIAAEPRSVEHLIFDAYGEDAAVSSDGKRLLFTREGGRWWRKGYRGSGSGQVWLYHLSSGRFDKLVHHETESRSPLWQPDGKGFYYVSGQSGAMNLWHREIESGAESQLTEYPDDSVVHPCLSADGQTIVFRHLFDLYRLQPGGDKPPQRLEILPSGDEGPVLPWRRTLDTASAVSFSQDGLEVAFIAGGDLWVMDTELREPRQITDSVEEETSPLFSPDGETILFVSDAEGQRDIWRATRRDPEQFWWQNERFRLERLTQDAATESRLKWSPAGDRVAFIRGRGDLWVMKPDGTVAKRLLKSWATPEFDWSPDGKWIVYAVEDTDFNRDVHIVRSDGSGEPVNISRHPDNDYAPRWSPDGKIIAWTGRRVGDEVDIHYVFLEAKQDQEQSRDRRIEKAIEKIKKARKQSKKDKPGEQDKDTQASPDDSAASPDSEPAPGEDSDPAARQDEQSEQLEVEVVVDLEDIHLRTRRVTIRDAQESNLFWSHDSEKLAFTATIDGRRGTYTITLPDELEPKLLSTATGSQARWISSGNQIVWLSEGRPASLSASGSSTEYSFSARQEVDLAARYQAAFDLCWRAMRDSFYDSAMNNRNWDAIRRKYAPQAKSAGDDRMFSTVVSLMLGELNASHLGFGARRSATEEQDTWPIRTAHLGLRFDPEHLGPGLRVRDVIPAGPADKVKSKISAGDLVLSIDGRSVDPAMDLTSILNGPLERDIHLRVRTGEEEERHVTLRPISYGAARALLYEKWVRDNQEQVAAASDGKFGYLHIRGMNMPSFYRFERELYAVAAGKEGILIDVRENGGGSTTDHLLTVLTQPEHAITVPRDGGPGYPQDRSVYATWRKPVVVLCNQNSFSNAEIFSHAIKTLKRGKLVGVPTAGGVISTGARRIMDLGILRMPFRGWFVLGSGEDMELNGAVPDVVLWPQPGEMPAGRDRQLDKAIELLGAEVAEWKGRPRPELRRASQRGSTP